MAHVLDNPVWHSLVGAHADLGTRLGKAARYDPEVSPFAAVSDAADLEAWADLAELVGPGGTVVLAPVVDPPATGWTVVRPIAGRQLVDASVDAAVDPAAAVLSTSDVPEMLDLVARTEPGPFLSRTVEMGGYVGIREDGRLVAMAGQRFHPDGWCEISAVCTHPDYQGRGLGARVVRTVVASVRAAGSQACLHVMADNTGAIRLYEALGFEHRREMQFMVMTCS